MSSRTLPPSSSAWRASSILFELVKRLQSPLVWTQVHDLSRAQMFSIQLPDA